MAVSDLLCDVFLHVVELDNMEYKCLVCHKVVHGICASTHTSSHTGSNILMDLQPNLIDFNGVGINQDETVNNATNSAIIQSSGAHTLLNTPLNLTANTITESTITQIVNMLSNLKAELFSVISAGFIGVKQDINIVKTE